MEMNTLTMWIVAAGFCGLLALTKACSVDNGEFITTIVVEEETEIGSVVAGLHFDYPELVMRVVVIDSNPYFDYLPANNSFVVKARIDVDEGLSTVQRMTLMCQPKNGPQLEIEVELELLDINDFTPEFTLEEYTFFISEAAIEDTQIAVLEARDRDIKNVYVEYELLATPYSALQNEHSKSNHTGCELVTKKLCG
ncbi:protocadherin gamma-A11-like [Watersipora subatra]|uniref:protocadherin gamma-A11-like n=1 Tax=Watersipora subatra TaxID=2589382 RepID=UPI00355BA109